MTPARTRLPGPVEGGAPGCGPGAPRTLANELLSCPEAVYGMHGTVDTRGRCPYCRRKVERATPPPARVPEPEDSSAYRYFYDPDFGTENRDVYA